MHPALPFLLLSLLACPAAAAARDIAGQLILPEGMALPDGAELHIRLVAPDTPPREMRRPAMPEGLSFALPTTAAGEVTLDAAIHAGARPVLVADPVTLTAPDSGPVSLALHPAVLPGNAAPFRCGAARITLAPDPRGLVLHRNGNPTVLDGPPGGPFATDGTTVTLSGNRVTLAGGTAPPVTCLPDIPPPLFPLSASGTEPLWSVAVSRDAMALALADGATELGQTPDLRPVPGGLVIFAAPDMNLTLGPGPCADAGTGAIHPFFATFAMPGLTLTGCGGRPAQSLDGDWTVTGIAGLPLDADPLPALGFDGPRLSGDTGCATLTAALSWQDAGLSIGPVATEGRACPATAAEDALLAALPTVTRAAWDPRLSVVRLLAGDRPAVTLARPAAD
jgi:uncharacterized membrane protein